MKSNDLRDLVNALTATAREFAGTQQLRERIAHVVRPAVSVAVAAEREACAQLVADLLAPPEGERLAAIIRKRSNR